VADEAEHVEAPVRQAEQRADAKVVLSHLEGAAQGIEPPLVVTLGRAGRVHARVGLVVVGLHEDLVRADAGGLDGFEARVIERCGVDVHAADFAMPSVDVVDVANAGRDEVGVVARMLAEHDDEAFVPLLFHRHHLLANLVDTESAADHVLVLVLKAAIGAVVHAHVAEVERREQHDAVAVHALLEFARRRKDLFAQLRIARV